MICRETRASGLLRARLMTAAGLVSETHMQLGCHSTVKFLIKRSFTNWQMYMRSIYWQPMPKVKKKSVKQRQWLDKVRKRDERATNEKEIQGVQLQAKHALKNRAYRVLNVHVANKNILFCCYIYICCLKLHQADYHVEEFLIIFF